MEPEDVPQRVVTTWHRNSQLAIRPQPQKKHSPACAAHTGECAIATGSTAPNTAMWPLVG